MSVGGAPRASIAMRGFERLCAGCLALMLMLAASVGHAQDQPPQSHTVDIKSAAWTADENYFAAVVGAAGSASALDTSVVLWDVRTGRIVGRIRFPDTGERTSVFIHSMAIFATRYRNENEFGVAISTSVKDEVSGTCSNLILNGRFEPETRSWQPDGDVNTPASCLAKDSVGLASPSGKYMVSASREGRAVFQLAPRRLLRALESPKAFQATDRRPAYARVGDAVFRKHPEIVLQTQSSAEDAKLALWTPDEKFVVAVFGIRGSVAARDHSLVVWDYRSGDIVNRVDLPDLGSNSSIFVHNMYISKGSVIELTASVRRPDGEPCKSIILTYKFNQSAGWREKFDLNRPALCVVEYRPNPESPSGSYRLSETQSPLAVLRPGKDEIFAALDKPEALAISDAALSPGGKTMAIIAGQASASGPTSPSIILFDLGTSRLKEVSLALGEGYDRVHWLNDNQFVLLRRDGTGPIPVFDAQTAKATGSKIEGQCLSGRRDEMIAIGDVSIRCRKPAKDDPPTPDQAHRLSGNADGSVWTEYDESNDTVYWRGIDGSTKGRKTLGQNVVAAGMIPNTALSWFATKSAGLFWTGTPAEIPPDNPQLPVTYFFPGGKFFSQRGFGYDTNLGADTKLFRWVKNGAGMATLGPQTFMRTSFQPQLARRMIECEQNRTCDDVFKTGFARTNTALPTVTIDRVVPGSEPNTASVEITVRENKGPGRSTFEDTTAVYNLRLFRNGALVAQFPKVNVDVDTTEIAAWRERNLVTLDADGTRHLSLPVALPTASQAQTIALTAYAFNEDRVKSETAGAEYKQPAVAKPRPRRAFVVTIGIDDYDEDNGPPDLQFAASDARLLSERLAAIPGYEVRRVTLAGETGKGKRVRVTALTIAQVIAILRGVDVKASIKALKMQGIDASQLEPPTPDDIVILSFSGHGWAEKSGAFYLVPADAKWLRGSEPDRATLISAVQIADRLRDVDAGEMAMIIDACHSAASVDAGGFKPGPMGDAGLGQLAFDKGIRILAATQADDVALEDPVLRQGLLTYALASEGITAKGGLADGDGDGRITLDEWLGYATLRMPTLSADARLGRLTTTASGARGWASDSAETRPPIQEPSLFDFNSRPSSIVLREGVVP